MSEPDFSTQSAITANVAYLRPEYAQIQSEFSYGTAPEHLADQADRPNMANMNTPTRDEFDLHLRHLDERLEGHFKLLDERMRSQTDLYAQWRDSQQKLADERNERLATAVKEIKDESAEARKENREQSRSLKVTIVTTAIATVLAIVGGIVAFNATLLSNMTSSFESGKATAAAITQATDQLKQTQDEVGKTQEQLKAVIERLAPAPSSAPKG